jgi:hypothetical protein
MMEANMPEKLLGMDDVAQLIENLVEIELVANKYFKGEITIIKGIDGWKAFFGFPTEEHIRNLNNPEGIWDIPIHYPTRPSQFCGENLSFELDTLLANGVTGRIEGYYPGKLTLI